MKKLYYYRVYVRHQYGTDKMIVTVKKRSVKAAGEVGRQRAIRLRKDPSAKVLDVIPMKYIEGEWRETRRVRYQEGEFKQVRKAKARTSKRQTRREAFAWSL